jgi:transcriptional regulator with PAS, ATPase and Fis domain
MDDSAALTAERNKEFMTRAHGVIACSAPMLHVLASAARTALRDSKVLITGESGVGKDVVARYIHTQSPRGRRPFVAVNCAALSETLLESELFGHVKGSFTGAYRDKPGKLQLADQGTIFLDEVGEMTPRMQALLLRFLESGEVQPVGADSINRRVDTRVITATNRDLQALATAGQFRADLMYRIRVVQIHVPPVRERPADIRPLAQHFLQRLDPTLRLTEEAWAQLEAYAWPGNVRELQNLAEQLASQFHDGIVRAQDLPAPLCPVHTRTTGPVTPDRRRTLADELFEAITSRQASFWQEVYTRFIDRDITRKDVRDVVARGLAASQGNYRELVRLFRLQDHEYKRLLNFLVRHDCAVDYRPFRRRSTSAGPTLFERPGMPDDRDAITEDGALHEFALTH